MTPPSDWSTGDSCERNFRDPQQEPDPVCSHCTASDECERLTQQLSEKTDSKRVFIPKLARLIKYSRWFMKCLREGDR